MQFKKGVKRSEISNAIDSYVLGTVGQVSGVPGFGILFAVAGVCWLCGGVSPFTGKCSEITDCSASEFLCLPCAIPGNLSGGASQTLVYE